MPRVAMVSVALAGVIAAGCQLLAGVHNDAVVGAGGAGGAGEAGPGACTLDTDCNDANPCTDDHCMSGVCVSVPNNMAVPDDHNECTVDACKDGVPSHDGVAPMGKKCGKGMSTFCDMKGNCHGCVSTADCLPATDCLAWNCDAMSNCAPQTAPLGKVATDPTPGDCVGAFCDGNGGVVMNALPAKTVCTANNGKLCDGIGHCLACILSGDCAMGQTCKGGVCLLAVGQACTDATLCLTNLCTGGNCAACKMNSDCQSGACDAMTGVCARALGQPCSTDQDCAAAGGKCTAGLCKLPQGSPCVADVECVTAFCNSKMCSTCTAPFDCPSMSCLGQPGMPGPCGLPSGAYCTANGQCASSMCTGTPPKCQ